MATARYAWLAIAADGVGALLYWLTADQLKAWFGRVEVDLVALGYAAVFALAWLLLVVGTVWLRQLAWPTPAAWGSDRQRLLAGLPAVAIGWVALADLTGYLETAAVVDFGDSGTPYYFLLTPAVLVGFALLYGMALIAPVERTADPLRRGAAALTAVSLFGVVAAAWLAAFCQTQFPGASPAAVGSAAWFVLSALLLLPRLLYSRPSRSWVGVLSLMALLAYYAAAAAGVV